MINGNDYYELREMTVDDGGLGRMMVDDDG